MLSGAQLGRGNSSAHEAVHIGRFALGPGALLRVALVATAIAYVQTITYAFVFDDLLVIEMNPWIQSWRFWRRFFTGDVWAFGRSSVRGYYYRPLFMLWVTGNYSLFQLTPGWWHLTLVAAHLVATGMVYVFAARLLRDRWTAVAAALLFGVYPAHIESVAWISAAPDVLLTIFVIGALLAYQNWIETRKLGWMAASVALFALSLLSKETALAFIPILAAYGWRGQSSAAGSKVREISLRLCPYLAVAGVYLIVRKLVLSGLATSNYPRSLSWVTMTMPAALWFYLRQLLWPFRLSLFYDFDLVQTFSARAVIVPLLLAVVAVAAFVYVGRRERLGLLAAVWILAPLAPVLAGMKVFQWHDYVHDRYLYVSSVMAMIVIAVGLKRIAGWIAGQSGRTPQIQFALTAVLAIAFATSTMMQSRQWESDLAVFAHAHEFAPRNPVPADYLARTLYGLGRTDEAVATYQKLLQTDPEYWQGNCVLGLAYYQMGRYEEAEHYLKIAARVWPHDFIRPESSQFYYLGIVQERKGEYADAELSLRKAVEIRPDTVGYRSALGTVLQKLGRDAEAQEQFRLEGENRKLASERAKEFEN